MGKEESSLSSKIVWAVSVVFILFIVIIIIILANGREIRTRKDSEPNKVTALVCTAGNVEGALFTSYTANTVSNEVKVTFSNGIFDKIFYEYNGVYRTYELAEQEETNFHIRYDEYVGSHGVLNSTFSPTYSTVGTKMQITLYTDKSEKINSVTAPLFFIDREIVENLGEESREKIKSSYENQGFSCEEQN